MSKKVLLALLLAAALLLAGCSLALPEDGDTVEDGDPMVGVLVTRQSLDLFDMDAYLRENGSKLLNGGTVSSADTEKYAQTLFAAWDEETQSYGFAGVDGYIWLCTEESNAAGDYTKMQSDGMFCDGSSAVNVTDEGESYTFSATLYAVKKNADATVGMFVNPLYQTADGHVYARAGQGISASGNEGAYPAMTQTLHQELTQNGKDGKTSRKFECTVKMQLTAEPEKVTLFWMDTEQGVLRQETYLPGTLPETLDAKEAQFLLCVETAADGAQTRKLYGPENETLTLETFLPAEDGLLEKQYTELVWE